MSESSEPRHQQHSSPAQVTSDDQDGAPNAARRWVRRKRIFAIIVGIYLALSVMWCTIDMLDDSTSLWFYWPILGTGLGVVVTGIRRRSFVGGVLLIPAIIAGCGGTAAQPNMPAVSAGKRVSAGDWRAYADISSSVLPPESSPERSWW